MANTTIYYPLIKKGFQEVADVSSIESDITQLESDVSSLQSNKVTKCFNAADLAALADEEIFQWQGNNATIGGTNFVNGYFYQKTTSQITIASGTFYVNFQNDFITPLFTIPKGYYYYVEDTTINYGYEIQKSFDNILWISLQPCAIGNPVTSVNGDIAYLTSVNNNYPVSDSLGRSWNNPTQVLSSGTFAKFKNYKTGLELLVALNEPADIVSSITCFGYLYNELLFPIYNYGWAAIKTTSQTSITKVVFAQTNTQPNNSYTLPVATPNILGGVKIGKYLDNSDSLTLDFSLLATGDDEMPYVDDTYFDVEVGTLWLHIFVFKVACFDNFTTKSHSIHLPFNFLFDFWGYIYDENRVCIGNYSLSGNSLTITKSDISTDFSLMDSFTFIAFG